MLSALLVALREGVEAALVVGIVLVYLKRTGRRSLVSYVWGGVLLAFAASFAAAILLDRWKVSEDGFEGLLLLLAAALVVTMIVWMNRVARSLRKEIEHRVENYAQQATRAAGWGIGAFVFLMVLREGAELVLVLRAVELSTAGVETWIRPPFVGWFSHVVFDPAPPQKSPLPTHYAWPADASAGCVVNRYSKDLIEKSGSSRP